MDCSFFEALSLGERKLDALPSTYRKARNFVTRALALISIVRIYVLPVLEQYLQNFEKKLLFLIEDREKDGPRSTGGAPVRRRMEC